MDRHRYLVFLFAVCIGVGLTVELLPAQTMTRLCSVKTDRGACEGESPEWGDRRVLSHPGRKEIVRIAAGLAMAKLAQCGSDVALVHRFGLSRCAVKGAPRCDLVRGLSAHDAPPPDSDLRFLVEDEHHYWPTSIRIVANYSAIQRLSDTAGRIHGEYFVDEFQYNVSSTGSSIIERHTAKHQEFKSEIEVFPWIFETGELCLSSERRWARSPIEAATYVLMHEIGHLESQFTFSYEPQRDDTRYPSMGSRPGATEREAWDFASSVARCGGTLFLPLAVTNECKEDVEFVVGLSQGEDIVSHALVKVPGSTQVILDDVETDQAELWFYENMRGGGSKHKAGLVGRSAIHGNIPTKSAELAPGCMINMRKGLLTRDDVNNVFHLEVGCLWPIPSPRFGRRTPRPARPKECVRQSVKSYDFRTIELP